MATNFGSPVEPEVSTTKEISGSTNLNSESLVASAGPSPVIASAIFSCSCGIDHSGLIVSNSRFSISPIICVGYLLYKSLAQPRECNFEQTD